MRAIDSYNFSHRPTARECLAYVSGYNVCCAKYKALLLSAKRCRDKMLLNELSTERTGGETRDMAMGH